MRSQFLLAAPHSGAGKTTVTLGLLRALRSKGLRTQPFKCGPDYIDPLHHHTAAGRASINLDQYMMSAAHIRDIYHYHAADADVAITEGVMGLFDGARKRESSSADLAILLGLPVILILNAKAMAYSAAAILYGLKNFDPGVNIAGVIFNFVDSASHYHFLQEAAEDAGVRSLGHLPTNSQLHIPSRHLGLDTADSSEAIAAAARHIENHLDLDAILAATATDTTNTAPSTTSIPKTIPKGAKTILVARDAAFHFLYPENLRHLESIGQLHFFSPLTTPRLPPADILYLPGGYPELHLPQLSANQSLLADIRTFNQAGGKIIAECGGMMFLGKSIIDEKGVSWPMAGILDCITTIQEKKLHLGYRTLTLDSQVLKGHEFHYSQFAGEPTTLPADNIPANAIITNARGQQLPSPVFHDAGVFASYMHFYWGESFGPLETWLTDSPR